MAILLKIVVSARHVDGEARVKYRVYKTEKRPGKPDMGEDFEVSPGLPIICRVKSVLHRRFVVEAHLEAEPGDLDKLLGLGDGWKRG